MTQIQSKKWWTKCKLKPIVDTTVNKIIADYDLTKKKKYFDTFLILWGSEKYQKVNENFVSNLLTPCFVSTPKIDEEIYPTFVFLFKSSENNRDVVDIILKNFNFKIPIGCVYFYYNLLRVVEVDPKLVYTDSITKTV